MIERILALDSLVGFLTLQERIFVQLERRDVYVLTNSSINRPRILKCLIVEYNWKPPEIKYNQDRCKVWLNTKTGNWEPIETYKHPILQEAINLISIIE